MKQMFKSKELGVLPCIHDCIIDSISYKESKLTFRYNNLQDHDYIIDQNISSNSLELTFELDDQTKYDFNDVRIEKHKSKTVFRKWLVKAKYIDIIEFLEKYDVKKMKLATTEIFTDYNCVNVVNCGEYTVTFELDVKSILFNWLD